VLSKAEAQSVLSGETTLKQVVRDGSVAAAAAAVDVELMNTTSKGKGKCKVPSINSTNME
tara:strand:- start:705 stop:884 length:180 start_codon:yes stop_codon:yes gene_type:complete